MASTISNYRVPLDKFMQFNDIIQSTGSRFIGDPVPMNDHFVVHCELKHGFWERWNRVTIGNDRDHEPGKHAAFWENSLSRVIARLNNAMAR